MDFEVDFRILRLFNYLKQLIIDNLIVIISVIFLNKLSFSFTNREEEGYLKANLPFSLS